MNPFSIITGLLGFVTGNKTAATVATGTVNGLSLAALIPGALYVLNHFDTFGPKIHALMSVPVMTVSAGDIAIVGVLFSFVLKLAHYLKSPGG